jgi:hypothetical protein
VVGREVNNRLVDGLIASFDSAIDAQWARARRAVDSRRLRAQNADAAGRADVDDIVRGIVRDFVRDMTAIGGAAGATASIPGPGTAVRVVGGVTAETVVILERAIFMILAVAHAYGLDLADIQVRRYAILKVLGAWAGVADGMSRFAVVVGQGLGEKATKAIPMATVHAVNRYLRRRVFVKWATKTGVVRLGSVLPFGIGVGLGATGNYVMAKGLARVAVNQFRPDEPESRRIGG